MQNVTLSFSTSWKDKITGKCHTKLVLVNFHVMVITRVS